MKKFKIALVLALIVGVAFGGYYLFNRHKAVDGVPIPTPEPPAVSNKADVEACYWANQLLLGKNVARSGHKIVIKNLPITVREETLMRALPSKEVLWLALKNHQLKNIETNQTIPLSDPVAVVSQNRMLCQDVEGQAGFAWQHEFNLWNKVRKKVRSQEDWETYLQKLEKKDKISVVILR